jgi:peptidoglycan/xylan/chitin deacetylase (PgdA/CDA1 family)
MRSAVAAAFLLFALPIGIGTAAECPQGALGVSRTIVVDPSEHQRLGGMQYGESLPLKDKEVVLTFDDGPLPPYTNRILETLASECVKATFFMVGRQVRDYPSLVRRIYNEGHTVANHSQNHPFTFRKMAVEEAAQEVEDGFASLQAALGDPKAVAPFFRIPGLLRQNSVEQYLAAHDVMTWSTDVLADDWTRINAKEVVKRAINRMEAHHKGILLLHDIKPVTALALPEILHELKARGYKIVHVVPATPDRPKTVTEPEQWAARTGIGQKAWPRTALVSLQTAEPELVAPGLRSFGLSEQPGDEVKISLVPGVDRTPLRGGTVPLPPVTPWPRQAYSVPAEVDALPAPGAQNFRYSRAFQMPSAKAVASAATRTTIRAKDSAQPAAQAAHNSSRKTSLSPTALLRPSLSGHQFSVVRPPLALTAPSTQTR